MELVDRRGSHAVKDRRGTFFVAFRVFVPLTLVLSMVFMSTSVHAQSTAVPNRVYFPQTGHYLSYGFLDYWRHYGDLAQFGYPLTEEFTDPNTGYTEQYFERAVFEWHPDAPSGWQIQLRRLGAEAVAGREKDPAFLPIYSAGPGCEYFSQTRHQICGHFLSYWESNGALPIYGYPLSEAFVEGNYTVQYFERARFEWHPQNQGTPYAVLLGLLGSDAATHDGVDTAPLAASPGVPDYSPELFTGGKLSYDVAISFHAQQDPDWCDPADVEMWLEATGVQLSGSDTSIQATIWDYEITHNDGFTLAQWHASPYAVAAALNAFGATAPVGDAAFSDVFRAGEVISRSLAVDHQPLIALVDNGTHYILVTGVVLGPGGVDSPPKSVTVYDPWTIAPERDGFSAMGQGTTWDWVTFVTRFTPDSTVDPGIWSGKWTLIAAGLPLGH